VIGMFDEELKPSTRAELLRLTPSGDLLDLARQMRDLGVESLLFTAPSGRIHQVVTDRQIAYLAANPAPVPAAVAGPPAASAEAEPLVAAEPADAAPSSVIPPQSVPSRADSRASVVRR
jgi:hypothetical protein